MNPNKELAEWLATEIMGWHKCCYPAKPAECWWVDITGSYVTKESWSPSSEVAMAIWVLEELKKKHWGIYIDYDDGGLCDDKTAEEEELKYSCQLNSPDRIRNAICGKGDTLHEALITAFQMMMEEGLKWD